MTGELASWNDTSTRAAIVGLVDRVTSEGGPDFVPPSWPRTGRRPLLAGGNANGDVEMLAHARFSLLVSHDDAEREFGYTAGAEKTLAAAAEHGWTVASIESDWATVFA